MDRLVVVEGIPQIIYDVWMTQDHTKIIPFMNKYEIYSTVNEEVNERIMEAVAELGGFCQILRHYAEGTDLTDEELEKINSYYTTEKKLSRIKDDNGNIVYYHIKLHTSRSGLNLWQLYDSFLQLLVDGVEIRICLLPRCDNLITGGGGGNRRKYCCNNHRIADFREKKKAVQ